MRITMRYVERGAAVTVTPSQRRGRHAESHSRYVTYCAFMSA